MSGKIVNNVFRASGVIAATPGGLDWSTAVVTGSTLTATAGKGYFINTTSNACTVTLPSSAEIGDQIVFADYARTWSTNNLIIDSNGNNFQGDPDTYTVDYSTAGQSLNIVYSDATKGWLPVSDDAVADVGVAPATQNGIYSFGGTAVTNLINSSGVVSADVTQVGTARYGIAATRYGFLKGIFGYGYEGGFFNATNLVSTSGVVSSDVTGVGTARYFLIASPFGSSGEAIFAYGQNYTNVSNKVSSAGVVATDTTGVGTARGDAAATEYGSDKALVTMGQNGGGFQSVTNLISNTGVVATDITGVGTVRVNVVGVPYGSDGAAGLYFGGIPAGAYVTNTRNLISNTGVISGDSSGAGTARYGAGGTRYGGDKAIAAFGEGASGNLNISNLINTSGAIASDVSGVGTARHRTAACGFGA